MADCAYDRMTFLQEVATLQKSLTPETIESNRNESQKRQLASAMQQAESDLVMLDNDFCNAVLQNVREGKQTMQLKRWSFKDESCKYCNGRYSLLNLLCCGEQDLLNRLQAWLDTFQSYEENGSTLKFVIGFHNVHGSKTDYALTVSWNPEGFEKMKEITSNTITNLTNRTMARRTNNREEQRETRELRETRETHDSTRSRDNTNRVRVDSERQFYRGNSNDYHASRSNNYSNFSGRVGGSGNGGVSGGLSSGSGGSRGRGRGRDRDEGRERTRNTETRGFTRDYNE